MGIITYETSGYKGVWQIKITDITEFELNRMLETIKKLNNIRKIKNGEET